MLRSIFCAHMVSMSAPDKYNALVLINAVYTKYTFLSSFLTKDRFTGFIELKEPDPPLDKFPSVFELNKQISDLVAAINAITKAKNGIKREDNAQYPLTESIINKIEHVKGEMKKDVQRTDYAAHVYVLNCLLHVQALLEERRFKATYMETIKAAQKAGAAPFY